MKHCKYEEKILEIHGDIKTLVAEFKAMNGSLKDTKERFDKHEEESNEFRYKVNITWFILQGIKWTMLGGIVWRGYDFIKLFFSK